MLYSMVDNSHICHLYPPFKFKSKSQQHILCDFLELLCSRDSLWVLQLLYLFIYHCSEVWCNFYRPDFHDYNLDNLHKSYLFGVFIVNCIIVSHNLCHQCFLCNSQNNLNIQISSITFILFHILVWYKSCHPGWPSRNLGSHCIHDFRICIVFCRIRNIHKCCHHLCYYQC